MNKVRILFFATLKDRAGTKSAEIEIPEGTTVHELKGQIGRLYPGLNQSLATALVSVNREYAFEDAVLPQDAEVAMFPAVSGG
jgi:molybdopterin converting factor subunit 1